MTKLSFVKTLRSKAKMPPGLELWISEVYEMNKLLENKLKKFRYIINVNIKQKINFKKEKKVYFDLSIN